MTSTRTKASAPTVRRTPSKRPSRKAPSAQPRRNAANIRKLALFLASGQFGFDMDESFARPACGSAGCIGGHAAVLWPHLREGEYVGGVTWDEAALAQHLGISPAEHDGLCFHGPAKDGGTMPLSDIDRSMAVATLRRLARTGKVYFDTAESGAVSVRKARSRGVRRKVSAEKVQP